MIPYTAHSSGNTQIIAIAASRSTTFAFGSRPPAHYRRATSRLAMPIASVSIRRCSSSISRR